MPYRTLSPPATQPTPKPLPSVTRRAIRMMFLDYRAELVISNMLFVLSGIACWYSRTDMLYGITFFYDIGYVHAMVFVWLGLYPSYYNVIADGDEFARKWGLM